MSSSAFSPTVSQEKSPSLISRLFLTSVTSWLTAASTSTSSAARKSSMRRKETNSLMASIRDEGNSMNRNLMMLNRERETKMRSAVRSSVPRTRQKTPKETRTTA